jgi:hypothetical protein
MEQKRLGKRKSFLSRMLSSQNSQKEDEKIVGTLLEARAEFQRHQKRNDAFANSEMEET